MLAIAAAAFGIGSCRSNAPGEPARDDPPPSAGGAPAVAVASTSTAPEPRAAAEWKGLLPVGARVEQQESVDLDADGVHETVVLSSTVDPDLLKTEGVSQDQIRMNLDLVLHIFASRAGRYVEIDRTAMNGGVRRVLATELQGGGRWRFVVASAMHCGASCAGMEVHVVGVTNGRAKHLLDRDTVADAGVTGEGLLAITEAPGAEERGAAAVVTYYAVSGEELVPQAASGSTP